MNYSDGWDKAIAEANVRVENGVTVDLKSEAPQPPAEAEIPGSGVVKPQQRDAIIFNVCRSFGMPELATSFIGDSRSLSEIMRGLYASHMQTRVAKAALRQRYGNWIS